MKERVKILLGALLLSLQSTLVFAHGDHEHPVMEPQEAEQAALRVADFFSQRDMGLGFGKLDASWAKLDISAAKVTVHEKKKGYFIVGVTNTGQGKTLFVLLSDSGDVYDANFSGDFPKLNAK